jgi:hypothetical protein
MSNRLEERILRAKTTLKNLKQQRREEERAIRAARPKKKPGRKPLSSVVLNRAKTLALKLPLTEVALRCDVSLKSLYNNGISRAAINKEKASDNI